MTTPSRNGRLPLHIALYKNASLGSIKLLVKGNPSAVQSPDNRGVLPLHVACEDHDSPRVVQYLLGLDIDKTTLDAEDIDGNSPLHYACRGARFDQLHCLSKSTKLHQLQKETHKASFPWISCWIIAIFPSMKKYFVIFPLTAAAVLATHRAYSCFLGRTLRS
mmetsp:Transcript_14980/g.25526  ORF Transcript_14980/g.25526 Transcript_14980/m.25526 type:complete len:163 (+) Transcript_14980:472-960(+)